METASPVLRSRAARPEAAGRTAGTRSTLNGSIPAARENCPGSGKTGKRQFCPLFFLGFYACPVCAWPDSAVMKVSTECEGPSPCKFTQNKTTGLIKQYTAPTSKFCCWQRSISSGSWRGSAGGLTRPAFIGTRPMPPASWDWPWHHPLLRCGTVPLRCRLKSAALLPAMSGDPAPDAPRSRERYKHQSSRNLDQGWRRPQSQHPGCSCCDGHLMEP